MKKLMFAVSAALCATVGFSDVTSQNVVGYAGSDLNVGMKRKLVTPQFSTVGGTDRQIRLGDIKPVSATPVGMGMVVIYTLQNTGVYDKTYIWNGSKWMLNGATDSSDTLLPEGKGLWVLCNSMTGSSVALQSAGEVNTTEDLTIRLVGTMKRTALGNGLPVDVTLADIVPTAVNPGVSVTMGMVVIYTLTETGVYDKTYIWNGSKWMLNGATDASTTTIPAGQGLWVLCNLPEATSPVDLVIKNPLKATK